MSSTTVLLSPTSPIGNNPLKSFPIVGKDTQSSNPTPQKEVPNSTTSDGQMKDAQQERDFASTLPPPPKTVSEKAKAAMVVLNRNRINYENDWDMPESILRSQALIEGFLYRQESIELIMPAFPFKSSNRSKKVLGALPDEAERVSLLHLNALCESVRDVTEHDCHLTIVSDGISYSDLLGVSDSEVWEYGQALRQLAETSDCKNIRFARIHEILGNDHTSSKPVTKEEYLSKVPSYRDALDENLPEGYNAAEQISGDEDIAKTYRGYKKFLETERDIKQARSRTEKENAVIAKNMLRRGKAFAETIRKAFPVSIRLSIHPSADINKISSVLLPQDNQTIMTPWHGALVRALDGSITMQHAHSVPSLTHSLIHENGRPTHFRERSELFDWDGKELSFEYMYPTGIIVRPRNPESSYALCTVDMQKVRFLAEKCSPIVLRGFAKTMERRAFTAKAYDLGEVLPWKSGIIQEVKDEANTDPTSNSVTSAEAMPMHYDGMFKLITVKDENGVEKQVSDAPRFQYFVAQSVAAPGDGYTLFASSALFTRYLPKAYPLGKLSKLRWTVYSRGFFAHTVTSLPLIVPHPTLGTPCVRWHQPWAKWRTAYGQAEVRIENGSQAVVPLVDAVLFDRRVCLYFGWERGDVLVSDNFSMLHTRTAFKGSAERELWRIHTN